MDTVTLECTEGAFETKTDLHGKPTDSITSGLMRKNGEMVVVFKKDEKTGKFLAEVPTEIALRNIRGKVEPFIKNYAQDLLNGYSFLKIHKINKGKVVESPVAVEPEINKKETKDEKTSV